MGRFKRHARTVETKDSLVKMFADELYDITTDLGAFLYSSSKRFDYKNLKEAYERLKSIRGGMLAPCVVQKARQTVQGQRHPDSTDEGEARAL